MPASVRSITQNAEQVTGTAGLTINKPAGLANGDILVAFLGAGDEAGGAYTCNGWTQASGTGSGAMATSTGNDIGSTVLRKVITDAPNEPASYTFVNTDTVAQNRSGFIVCVKDGDPDAPIDELTQQSGTNTWRPDQVDITTKTANALVLMFHAGNIGTAAAKTAGAPATPSGAALIGAIATSRVTANYIASEAAYYAAGVAGVVTIGAWTGTPTDTTSEFHLYSVSIKSKAGEAYSGSVSVSGNGSTVAVGTKGGRGAATVSGAGAVAALGFAAFLGIAVISGGGAIQATSFKNAMGAVSVSGGGSTSAIGMKGARASPAVSGGGSTSAIGIKATLGSVVVSGGGSVTAVGQKAEGEQYSGSAVVSGGGAVSAIGVKGGFGTVSVSGGGQVVVHGPLNYIYLPSGLCMTVSLRSCRVPSVDMQSEFTTEMGLRSRIDRD